ncbi:hypothetical protein [Spirochaeta cellobiosiphila]|uniref:hypothetical protein n=1 Tax=Spirochaeta cellobiosiphila TaxID=504483 RepID=UPI0003FF1C01|nr:hypothetical protein [Spirochaeta cellobiosiphila]
MLDTNTGLSYGPITLPLGDTLPPLSDIKTALEDMILSASGWRKVFAPSHNEEDPTEELSEIDYYLAAGMAYVFGQRLLKESQTPTVALGLDARPTGPAMASAMIPVFRQLDINVEYLFIASAPEIMAYAKTTEHITGFAYISASHNPIGHNGAKFGLSSGGVLPASEVNPLIEQYKNVLQDITSLETIKDMIQNFPSEQKEEIFRDSSKYKRNSLQAYEAFSKLVYTQEEPGSKQDTYWSSLKNKLTKKPLSVLGELNGSARGVTIDRDFLPSLGIKVSFLNDKPRQIVHRIVPEGQSLDLCKNELEKLYQQDPSYTLGYVPDNDGDRGNIVAINPNTGLAEILEAQEVFALSCLSLLGESEYKKQRGFSQDQGKTAIVVNGPTSMRIDDICRAFGAELHRAEVGEANVVGKANLLRSQGYYVPLLGEGSNGGNITHPAAVRDPLNTIGALIKLMNLVKDDQGPGLFEMWCKKSGQAEAYKDDFSLTDIRKTLPSWITTSAYEAEAILKIKSTNHGQLKKSYESLFLDKWKGEATQLESQFGIHSWEEINYEGGEVKEGFGPDYRSGLEKGGFKILFRNKEGEPIAYLWMRGSATEPVFRVMVDVKSSEPAQEKALLQWHRNLVIEADKKNQESLS